MVSEITLANLSDRMAGIDFAMLPTRTDGGSFASWPMSNNGEVEYRGDSCLSPDEAARSVFDIASDAKVGLTFTGAAGLFGIPLPLMAPEGEIAL